jgi:transposase
MAYIEGEQRGQHTLFPMTLDELIPQDHVCRVIQAFVDRLDVAKMGFVFMSFSFFCASSTITLAHT